MAFINLISSDNFEQEVIKEKKIVFVDFFAHWCGPCNAVAPVLEEISENPFFKEKVKFVKINVDENQKIASRYNVFSIPAFYIFKNGVIVDQFVGIQDKKTIEEKLKNALSL